MIFPSGPDAVALGIGVLAALLITLHQHRSTTAPPTKDPQDGDRHDQPRPDTHPQGH